MKISEVDWSYIKKPFINAMVIFVVASGVWYTSHYYAQSAKQKYDKHTKRNKILQRKIHNIQADIKLYAQNSDAYLNLLQRSVINVEQRLDWVARFRDVSKQLKLRSARYEVAASRPLKRSDIKVSRVKLFYSRMRVKLDVLHETDILTLFKSLDQAQGLYHASNCEFKHKEQQIIMHAAAPNISVYCDVDWYTIHTSDKNKQAAK